MSVKSDGSLWAWGNNSNGKLGDGTTTDRIMPVKVMDDVMIVDAGYYHTMAVKTDSSLWAWGGNENGRLGDGTLINRSSPIKIMDDVAFVSTKYNHTMAIKKDGSLWAWGENGYGQLGDGTSTNRITPTKIMDEVIHVSVGYYHTMVIKSDGSLWAWGENRQGKLGDSTNAMQRAPVKIMDEVTFVSSCNDHTMVIKTDGSLWAWGYNSDGRLGDGTLEFRSRPVKVMDEVSLVAAGYFYSIAIKKDGSLWAWGKNVGQLGDGTTEDRYSPTRIMEGVSSVSAGGTHVLATKTDGSLWAWGFNGEGRLGGGGSDYSLVPIKIMDNVLSLGEVLQTDGYMYDEPDLGLSIDLPVYLLDGITDQASAIAAIEAAATGLTEEQRQSASGIDLVTLFAEEAIARAATINIVGSEISINQSNLQPLQALAENLRIAAEKTLISSGVTPQRNIRAEVRFWSETSENIIISIDTTTANIAAEGIRVETPNYAMSFPASIIKENTGTTPLVVTISETGSEIQNLSANQPAKNIPLYTQGIVGRTLRDAGSNAQPYDFATSIRNLGFESHISRYTVLESRAPNYSDLQLTSASKSYSITINKTISEKVKISLTPTSEDPRFQAIVD